MYLSLLAFIIALGIDNLAISTAIGLSGSRNKLQLAFSFAFFEAIMPLFGFFLGSSLGTILEKWAFYAGIVLLFGVGVHLLFTDEEREEKLVARLAGSLRGSTLILTGILISLDEMFVGSSFGMIGLPIVLTSLMLGIQAFVFTWIGITFAERIRPMLGEWTEKLPGVILIVLALGLLVDRFIF